MQRFTDDSFCRVNERGAITIARHASAIKNYGVNADTHSCVFTAMRLLVVCSRLYHRHIDAINPFCSTILTLEWPVTTPLLPRSGFSLFLFHRVKTEKITGIFFLVYLDSLGIFLGEEHSRKFRE